MSIVIEIKAPRPARTRGAYISESYAGRDTQTETEINDARLHHLTGLTKMT